MPRKLSKVINYLFTSRLQEIPFIIFLSFLLTFIITRGYVYITSHDILTSIFNVEYITINGVHVHHLTWGIILISITGFISLYNIHPLIHRRIAILYGIGLGLTFDEYALWLRLQDNYYAKITYDAIVIISLIFLNIIYFPDFWKKMAHRTTSFLPVRKPA